MSKLPAALVVIFVCFVLAPGAVRSSEGLTFTVDTTDDAVDVTVGDDACLTDDGRCSLRAAIQEANANPASTIVLPAGTYPLIRTGRGEDAAATGDLDVTAAVEIVGNATVDALDGDRAFDITCSGCTVVLSGLDVVNGSASEAFPDDGWGGGIRNRDAVLKLLDVGVVGAGAEQNGGGIATFGGEVHLLQGSRVSGATAFEGGGIANLGGRVVLDGVTIDGNEARTGVGGGIYNDARLELHEVVLTGNTSGGEGGAIANRDDADATIRDSVFSGNRADGNGGALFNHGTATIERTTFAGNGSAGSGGAVFNEGAQALTLTNSTLTGNTADGSGGGIYSSSSETAVGTNLTIADNVAAEAGGGVYVAGGGLRLRNTILAGASNCGGAPVTSDGHNLDSGASCALPAGDLSNVDPKLAPAGSNGGFSPTRALLAGSPAIDAGTGAGCPTTDQRDAARPADGNGDGTAVCDIGAVEAPAPALPAAASGGGGGGGGAAPDLRLVGSVEPAVAPVGAGVGFVLHASTPDDVLAQNVVVTVGVPPGLTVTATSTTRGPGCGPATNGTMACDLDFLSGGAGKTGTITIAATVDQAGEHVLAATLTSRAVDRNATDNSVELRVTTPTPVLLPPQTPTRPAGRTLSGTAAADTLRGGAGPDVLFGRGGNDTLFGAGGDDRLVGGAGRDTLAGGPGNDRLEARDRVRDVVRCGAGLRDLAIVDRVDAVSRDCELVRRG